MGVLTGLQPIADLTTGSPSDPVKVARVMALIPDPDNATSTGAVAGGGFLDEMSPAAAAQLRVELTALAAAVS